MSATGLSGVYLRNWNYAGVTLFLGFFVLPLAWALFTWAFLTGQLVEKNGETHPELYWCIEAALALGTVAAFYHALTSPVLWLNLGEQITYRNVLRRSTVRWSDVSSLYFVDEQSRVKTKVPGVAIPLGRHRILVMELTSKKELRVKVTGGQEEIISRLRELYRGTGESTAP